MYALTISDIVYDPSDSRDIPLNCETLDHDENMIFSEILAALADYGVTVGALEALAVTDTLSTSYLSGPISQNSFLIVDRNGTAHLPTAGQVIVNEENEVVAYLGRSNNWIVVDESADGMTRLTGLSWGKWS